MLPQSPYFKRLFFPFVAMLAAVSFVGPCLNKAVRLAIPIDLPQAVLGVMQLSVVLLSTILIILLLLITRKVAMQKWIKALFIGMICGFILAYSGVKFFSLESQLTDSQLSLWLMKVLPMPYGHLLAAAMREWRLGLLMLLSSTFSPSLLLVMVWGFINQVTRLGEAMKFYIAMLFLAGLPSWMLSLNPVYSWLTIEHCYLAVITSLAIALAVFLSICGRLPDERWQDDGDLANARSCFWVVAAFGLLIAGLMIVKQYSGIILNGILQQEMDSFSFDMNPFIGHYAFWAGVTALTVACLVQVTGPWLIRTLGWGMTALIPPLAVLGTLLVIVLGSRYRLFPISFNAFHEGLLMGLRGALLIPLIQMGYLFFPKRYRFQLNGWSTLIAAPVISGMASVPAEGLIYFFEGPWKGSPYLIGLASLILLLMVFAILYLTPQKVLAEPQEV